MKKFFKIQSWNFCDRVHARFIFSAVKKDNYCAERQEKISILEYFKIIPCKKQSTQQQMLLKELILYINSDSFQKEFKYSLSNENRVFKFYLLNLSLLAYRAEEVKSKVLDEFLEYKKKNIFKPYNKSLLYVLSLSFSFKYLPLHFIYEDFYKEYAKKYLIRDSFQEVFTEKFFKKMKMLDIKYLRHREAFAKELNQLDLEIEAYYLVEGNAEKKFDNMVQENETFKKKYENFLRKYFISFIFEIKSMDKPIHKVKGNDKKLDELDIYARDVDKLFTYFLAHVSPYLNKL